MNTAEQFLKVDGWGSGFKSVDRAIKHYLRRIKSEKTKYNLVMFLHSFCRFAGKSPDELVALEKGKVSDLLQSYVDDLVSKGRSIRYVNVCLAYLKVFFRENGFKNGKEVEVERYFQPARYRKKPEYIPTSDEVQKMVYACRSLKDKAVVLTLYTSGLRVSTLKALRIRDVLDEVDKSFDVVKVPVYPEMKEVEPDACKGNIPYFTFVNRECVQILKQFLEERKKIFGDIGKDEPLFYSTSTNLADDVKRRTAIKQRTIEEVVKRAARNALIERWADVTPHGLRKAFESALRNNGLDVKDQEFLMGHIIDLGSGTQDAYYDRTKAEDLRVKYARVKFFQTSQVDKLEMIKAFAKTLGINDMEVKIAKLREKEKKVSEEEAVNRIVRSELGIEQLKTRNVKYKDEDNGKYESRIITEADLLKYLDEGWNLIKELNNGKIVVRKEKI